MSTWLMSSATATHDPTAARALAAELRSAAAGLDVVRDLLERAWRAMPSGAECEGWVSAGRTQFDDRVRTLLSAILAGSNHAELARDHCTRLALDAEQLANSAALAAAAGGVP